MLNLLPVIAGAAVTVVSWLSYLKKGRPVPLRLVLIRLWATTLLLALRFGARTYPGVYVPSNEILNWVFNGPRIFGIGYMLTLVAATCDAGAVLGARVFLPAIVRIGLVGVASIAALLAVAIASSGFVFALILQRLPH